MAYTSENVSNDLESILGRGLTQDIVDECLKICNTYAISPENLAFKWQALDFNRTLTATGSTIMGLDMAGVAELRDKIKLELSSKPKQEQARHQQSTKRGAPLQVRHGPRQTAHSYAGSGAGIKQSIATGADRGAMNGSGARSASSGLSFPIKILDNLEDRNYRYMYERMAERSTVLDDRIDEFSEMVREYYSLEDIQGPTETSEEEAVIVGRICTDAETEQVEGKLHDGAFYLETSRMIDAGTRGPIKFNPNLTIRGARPGTSSIGFFPGAIAAFKGRNATGDWFQVSEVLSLPRLTGRNSGFPKQPWTMAVAAGPYTSDSDLEYTPFLNLLQELESSPPAYVLLLGPFIDQKHPKIESGDIDVAPPELFKQKILGPLRKLLNEAPHLRILIVPNPRDLIYDHAVFPQRSYGSFGLERTITVPNPCTFILDGVQFSTCSVDVLLHLRKAEFQMRTEPTPGDAESVESARNSLANAFRHVLDQRSFYPLFPTPLAYSADVNLDVSHSELLKLEEPPDVLVLPSALGKFHKVIDSTACLNPSYVSKGSFMTLHVLDGNTASSMGLGPSRSLSELITVRQHTLTV